MHHLIEFQSLNGSSYFGEIEPGLSFEKIVSVVMSRMDEKPLSVFSFNPETGTSANVTKEVAKEVASLVSRHGEASDDTLEFIEAHAGRRLVEELYSEQCLEPVE